MAERLPSLELVLPPEPEAVFLRLEAEGPAASLGEGEPSLRSPPPSLLCSEEDEEDALPFSPAPPAEAAAATALALARLKRCCRLDRIHGLCNWIFEQHGLTDYFLIRVYINI